jgi:single-stranded-DNA-specific exonuclease
VVTDHHLPPETLPVCDALVDPKIPAQREAAEAIGALDLCGAGIAFFLASALVARAAAAGLYDGGKFGAPLLVLAGLATVVDIVPLLGQNRILAANALRAFRTAPVGLQELLLRAQRRPVSLTSRDFGFLLGPRINAAGRMRSGMDAVKLLISNDFYEAVDFAKEISHYNDDRKEADRSITECALAMLQSDPENSKKTSTVVCGNEWHKGVVGIVASRLTETYYRPTIVLSRNGDMLTGSARSVSDFNLYDAIDSCRQYLTAFGGHKFAAGLSMKAEVYDDFRRDFEDYVSSHIQDYQKRPTITIERYISFAEITDDFYRKLQEFQPFGPENPEPIFATRGVVNYGKTRAVGKELPPKHLRLEVMDASKTKMVGIGFGLAAFADVLKAGKAVDICYTVVQNEFNGRKSLQLMVKDIKA